MEEFKDLEKLWKQFETKAPETNIDSTKIKNNRMKLLRTYTVGALLLILTAILILIIMSFLDAELQTPLVIGSMIIISVICILQASLMIFTAQKIKRIDESQTAAQHLRQWLQFREFQRKQRRWNMPVYYVLLSLAVGVYMFELLKNTDLWKMVLAFVITYSWLFSAYFYLGRKEVKKQDAKLDGIIFELKALENQFV